VTALVLVLIVTIWAFAGGVFTNGST